MDFSSNKAPEIRIAPEHKPVKVPKRPTKPEMRFYRMKDEELMAFMISALRFRYDPHEYKTDQKYKSTADSILFMGMIAMMTHYLRSQGIDTDKLIGSTDSKLIV